MNMLINADITIAAVALQWILQLNTNWRVYGNGVIELNVKAKKNKEVPFLPRFGVRMFLNDSFNKTSYFWFWSL